MSKTLGRFNSLQILQEGNLFNTMKRSFQLPGAIGVGGFVGGAVAAMGGIYKAALY